MVRKTCLYKTKDIEQLIKIRGDNKVFVDHTFVYHPRYKKLNH